MCLDNFHGELVTAGAITVNLFYGELKRVSVQVYLSEATREFILKYMSRAHKVVPAGIKKGQVMGAQQQQQQTGNVRYL